MKRILFPLLVFAIIPLATFSTNQPLSPAPPSGVSPNTESLGEYGSMPVNLFSGTPSVEIPLMTMNFGGGHTWPISLIYTSSGGVKPAQPSGIVGMGWSLKSAGMITRIKNNLPDEERRVGGTPTQYEDSILGWFYRHDLANISWNNTESLRNTMTNYLRGDEFISDLEPDVFNFNFLDYHGTFFMGEDGEWKVRCNRDIRVEFKGEAHDFIDLYKTTGIHYTDAGDILQLQSGYSKSFKRFILVDEHGTRYTFGGNNESIEYYIPFFTQRTDRLVASAWHLTKVEYADGRRILFSYMADRPYVAQMTYNSYSWYLSTISVHGQLSVGCMKSYDGPKLGGNLVMPVYLTEISSDEDNLSLEYDADESEYYDFRGLCYWETRKEDFDEQTFLPLLIDYGIKHRFNDWYYPGCLDAIQRKKLKMLKYCNFEDSVYNWSFNYDQSRHLILESVHNDATGGMYNFEYYKLGQLPVFPLGIDAWGYFNCGGNEIADGECQKYGILTKIKYPTGGYTRFDYERHTYSMSATELRGGIISH